MNTYVITGCRDALTYVQQLARSREFTWQHMLLNALHFMMLRHDLRKWPGRYRPGDIHIDEAHTSRRVYTGPDADDVPSLISELIDWLADGEPETPLLVRVSMAHLNLVKIHPWQDGNGRMSRCLHTLVLARDGVLAPEFSSIEEWLGVGRNTYAYYDALAEVGGPTWQPDNDTSQWIRFCLSAHHQQAQLVRQRLDQAAHLWELLDPGSDVTACPSGSSAPYTSPPPAAEYAAPSINATRTSPTTKQPATYAPSSGRTCSNNTARPEAGSTSPRRHSATSPPPRCAQRKSSTRTDGEPRAGPAPASPRRPARAGRGVLK
ncbi:Fic family protein [Micromonospora sp. NPDC049275]|uniref:Fic family protein n=1 Tax=Micromonospora sp. NPDC049275 TaxID=3364268 RepID=UPI00371BE830